MAANVIKFLLNLCIVTPVNKLCGKKCGLKIIQELKHFAPWLVQQMCL